MNCYILKDVLIHYFLGEYRRNSNNYKLYKACLLGHRELAKWMIHKGVGDLNWGLFGACRGGHRHIVELMILKGANDLDWGLEGSCEGEHQGLVEWMVKLGANRSICYNSKHCHC